MARASKVCARAGCPHVVPCPVHKQTTQRSPSSRVTGTRAWRGLRAQILARDRYRCTRCGQPATEVHHVQPVARGGKALPHPSLLTSLCDDCHDGLHSGQGRVPSERGPDAVRGCPSELGRAPYGFSGGRDGR